MSRQATIDLKQPLSSSAADNDGVITNNNNIGNNNSSRASEAGCAPLVQLSVFITAADRGTTAAQSFTSSLTSSLSSTSLAQLYHQATNATAAIKTSSTSHIISSTNKRAFKCRPCLSSSCCSSICNRFTCSLLVGFLLTISILINLGYHTLLIHKVSAYNSAQQSAPPRDNHDQTDAQSYSAPILGSFDNSGTDSTSSVLTSYYRDCLASFYNRSHSLNNGVSIRIGVFSVWDKADQRQHWRDTIGQWKPVDLLGARSIPIYCKAQEQLLLRKQGMLPPDFVPASPIHPKPYRSYSHGCSDAKVHSLDMSWWSIYDNIDIVFVMGASATPNRVRDLALEQESLLYNDIMVLDQEENMNNGKSLKYMQTVAAMNAQRQTRAIEIGGVIMAPKDYEWDYVMKLDDDSFLHIPNLITNLRSFRLQALEEVYYGLYYHYPHLSPPPVKPSEIALYMSGMGYVMSLDLASYFLTPQAAHIIAQTKGMDTPENNIRGAGHEDMNWGWWLAARGRALGRDQDPMWQGHTGESEEAYRRHHALVKNFINAAPNMYSYPAHGKWDALPQLHSETIIVHELKHGEWQDLTIQHFMCQQRVHFQWEQKWWKKDPPPVLYVYQFNEDATPKKSSDWWDDWGQSYRENKEEQASTERKALNVNGQ